MTATTEGKQFPIQNGATDARLYGVSVANGMTANIGKDFPKIPRGRPRLLSPRLEDFCRHELLSGKPVGVRTVQNSSYYAKAMNCLLDADKDARSRWGWLLRPGANQDIHPRMAIMYQLGRTSDTEALVYFADSLCKRRLAAEASIQLLRTWQRLFRKMQAEEAQS